MADPRFEVWLEDHVAAECGFFTSDTTVNGGYGCCHPEQATVEDEDADSSASAPPESRCGPCSSFRCPIAARFAPSEDPADKAMCARLSLNPADYGVDEWMLVAVNEAGQLIGRKEVTNG